MTTAEKSVVCCLVSMCVIHTRNKSKLKRFCLSFIFLVFIIVEVDASSVFDVCVDAASPQLVLYGLIAIGESKRSVLIR